MSSRVSIQRAAAIAIPADKPAKPEKTRLAPNVQLLRRRSSVDDPAAVRLPPQLPAQSPGHQLRRRSSSVDVAIVDVAIPPRLNPPAVNNGVQPLPLPIRGPAHSVANVPAGNPFGRPPVGSGELLGKAQRLDNLFVLANPIKLVNGFNTHELMQSCAATAIQRRQPFVVMLQAGSDPSNGLIPLVVVPRHDGGVDWHLIQADVNDGVMQEVRERVGSAIEHAAPGLNDLYDYQLTVNNPSPDTPAALIYGVLAGLHTAWGDPSDGHLDQGQIGTAFGDAFANWNNMPADQQNLSLADWAGTLRRDEPQPPPNWNQEATTKLIDQYTSQGFRLGGKDADGRDVVVSKIDDVQKTLKDEQTLRSTSGWRHPFKRSKLKSELATHTAVTVRILDAPAQQFLESARRCVQAFDAKKTSRLLTGPVDPNHALAEAQRAIQDAIGDVHPARLMEELALEHQAMLTDCRAFAIEGDARGLAARLQEFLQGRDGRVAMVKHAIQELASVEGQPVARGGVTKQDKADATSIQASLRAYLECLQGQSVNGQSQSNTYTEFVDYARMLVSYAAAHGRAAQQGAARQGALQESVPFDLALHQFGKSIRRPLR